MIHGYELPLQTLCVSTFLQATVSFSLLNFFFMVFNSRNKVYAWTVDDETQMQRMLVKRVDAMVTGNPTLLQRLIQDIRIQCLEQGFSFS